METLETQFGHITRRSFWQKFLILSVNAGESEKDVAREAFRIVCFLRQLTHSASGLRIYHPPHR